MTEQVTEQQCYIRGVPPDALPADVAAVAALTGGAAADALGLPWVPDIVFFELCGPEHPDAVGPVKNAAHMGGRTSLTRRTERILIRADLAVDLTERVVAHELRHVWQGWQGLASSPTAELERDAREFDTRWMERKS